MFIGEANVNTLFHVFATFLLIDIVMSYYKYLMKIILCTCTGRGFEILIQGYIHLVIHLSMGGEIGHVSLVQCECYVMKGQKSEV